MREQDLRRLVYVCHAAAANWWKDLETGEPLDRNNGEMICLQHSETSEAWKAYKHKLPDEHCPDFSNFIIELADIVIRIGDYIGGRNLTDDFIVGYQYLENNIQKVMPQPVLVVPYMVLDIHEALSDAMEADRKSLFDDQLEISEVAYHLAMAIQLIEIVVDKEDLNLDAAIEAKMHYNAHRADHKRENRLKDNGKAY